MTEATTQPPEFDVAVSFAGEDREVVEQVVRRLQELGVGVFYDQDHVAELWGVNLVDFLPEVYGRRVRYVLLFASRHYVAKKWTRVERQAAQDRAFDEDSAYILPVRLDDTPVPGLPATVGYLDLPKLGVEQVAQAVVAKLAGQPGAPVRSRFDGRAPRTPQATAVLLAERPPGWEYLLYAGTIRQGIDALADKYRDHVLGYAPRGGVHLDDDADLAFFRRNHVRLTEIVDSIDRVLAARAQDTAFGAPGVAGEPDWIVHLGNRLVGVYEELLDWSRTIRGTNILDESARHLALVQARYADAPLEAIRQLADDYVALADTLVERLHAGENITHEMTLTVELDPALAAELDAALARVRDGR